MKKGIFGSLNERYAWIRSNRKQIRTVACFREEIPFLAERGDFYISANKFLSIEGMEKHLAPDISFFSRDSMDFADMMFPGAFNQSNDMFWYHAPLQVVRDLYDCAEYLFLAENKKEQTLRTKLGSESLKTEEEFSLYESSSYSMDFFIYEILKNLVKDMSSSYVDKIPEDFSSNIRSLIKKNHDRTASCIVAIVHSFLNVLNNLQPNTKKIDKSKPDSLFFIPVDDMESDIAVLAVSRIITDSFKEKKYSAFLNTFELLPDKMLTKFEKFLDCSNSRTDMESVLKLNEAVFLTGSPESSFRFLLSRNKYGLNRLSCENPEELNFGEGLIYENSKWEFSKNEFHSSFNFNPVKINAFDSPFMFKTRLKREFLDAKYMKVLSTLKAIRKSGKTRDKENATKIELSLQ